MDEFSYRRTMLGFAGLTSVVVIAGQFVSFFLTQSSIDKGFKQAQLMQECLLWVGAGGQFLEKTASEESIEFIRDCYPSDASATVYGYEYTSEYISLDNHDYDSIPEGVERSTMKKGFYDWWFRYFMWLANPIHPRLSLRLTSLFCLKNFKVFQVGD